jgi:hypothetical protein
MKLKESKKELVVVYVSSIGSSTQYIDEKNYKKLDNIFDAAWKDIESQQTDVGEIWVDTIWTEGIEAPDSIDWKALVVDKHGLLDSTIIEKVFKDDEFAIKAGFIIDVAGKSVDINKYIDDVQVYDARHDDWIQGNYNSEYPESWLDEYVENVYDILYKEIEKVHAEGYFNWARLVSDKEMDGSFESSRMGDYFVYMPGHF